MKMTPAYVAFYLDGREDRLLKHDIDTVQVAEEVGDGKGSIHELLVKAATSAAEPLRVDRKKRSWLEEYADEIKEAGGDGELAYQHYIQGRIDEVVHRLDGDVVEELSEMNGDESDEDEDEEEDEEDEEDEEESKPS